MTDHDDASADAVADDPRLSAWLDDELTPTERRDVDELLEADPRWAEARDDTASVRTLLRDLAPAEPPVAFLESLLASDIGDASVTNLDAARRRRSHRSTAAFAVAAVAAAALIAVVVPSVTRVRPALATDVRVHQAGVSASSDPVSGLAPLGASLRLGK
jgi:anti-sigma factor RsiW